MTKSVSLDDEVSWVFKGEVSSTTLMEGLSAVAAEAARPEGLTISSSVLPGSTELTALVADK